MLRYKDVHQYIIYSLHSRFTSQQILHMLERANLQYLDGFLGLKEEVFPVITTSGKSVRCRVNFGQDEFVWKGSAWDEIKFNDRDTV